MAPPTAPRRTNLNDLSPNARAGLMPRPNPMRAHVPTGQEVASLLTGGMAQDAQTLNPVPDLKHPSASSITLQQLSEALAGQKAPHLATFDPSVAGAVPEMARMDPRVALKGGLVGGLVGLLLGGGRGALAGAAGAGLGAGQQEEQQRQADLANAQQAYNQRLQAEQARVEGLNQQEMANQQASRARIDDLRAQYGLETADENRDLDREAQAAARRQSEGDRQDQLDNAFLSFISTLPTAAAQKAALEANPGIVSRRPGVLAAVGALMKPAATKGGAQTAEQQAKRQMLQFLLHSGDDKNLAAANQIAQELVPGAPKITTLTKPMTPYQEQLFGFKQKVESRIAGNQAFSQGMQTKRQGLAEDQFQYRQGRDKVADAQKANKQADAEGYRARSAAMGRIDKEAEARDKARETELANGRILRGGVNLNTGAKLTDAERNVIRDAMFAATAEKNRRQANIDRMKRAAGIGKGGAGSSAPLTKGEKAKTTVQEPFVSPTSGKMVYPEGDPRRGSAPTPSPAPSPAATPDANDYGMVHPSHTQNRDVGGRFASGRSESVDIDGVPHFVRILRSTRNA